MGAHNSVPDDSSPNADIEVGVIPMFANSMRIIPCPQVTAVDVELISHVKHALSVHRMLCKKSSFAVC
jgi:hypothetical protein